MDLGFLLPERIVAQVLVARIRENRHNDALFELRSDLQSGQCRRTGGYAHAQPFFARQAANHRMSLLGLDLDHPVWGSRVKDLWLDGAWDVLEPLKTVKCGIGLHGDDFYVRIEFAQRAGDAHQGTGSAP